MYFDWCKYKLFPNFYKIIYDKIYRPNLFEKINNNTIFNIRHNNKHLDIELLNLNSFSLNESNKENNQSMEEFIILQYYDNVFSDIMTSFTILSMLVISKCITRFTYQYSYSSLNKHLFIFLDNNRLIKNNLIKKFVK